MARLQVLQFGGINHRCDFANCTNEADWRARDRKTGDVVAAACKTHQASVRAAALEMAQKQRTAGTR